MRWIYTRHGMLGYRFAASIEAISFFRLNPGSFWRPPPQKKSMISLGWARAASLPIVRLCGHIGRPSRHPLGRRVAWGQSAVQVSSRRLVACQGLGVCVLFLCAVPRGCACAREGVACCTCHFCVVSVFWQLKAAESGTVNTHAAVIEVENTRHTRLASGDPHIALPALHSQALTMGGIKNVGASRGGASDELPAALEAHAVSDHCGGAMLLLDVESQLVAAASSSDQELSDTRSIEACTVTIVLSQSCNSFSCHAFRATMNDPNKFTSSWAALAATRSFVRHTTEAKYLGAPPTTLGRRLNCIQQSFFSTLWSPSTLFVCAPVRGSLNVLEWFTVRWTAPGRPAMILGRRFHNLCSRLPALPVPRLQWNVERRNGTPLHEFFVLLASWYFSRTVCHFVPL